MKKILFFESERDRHTYKSNQYPKLEDLPLSKWDYFDVLPKEGGGITLKKLGTIEARTEWEADQKTGKYCLPSK